MKPNEGTQEGQEFEANSSDGTPMDADAVVEDILKPMGSSLKANANSGPNSTPQG